MAVFAGPEVVNNGLVFYLDAANSRSYPGSGTTWFDLSGNSNNGTLINSVGYGGNNLGALVFDGINDHCLTNISTINTMAAYEVWVKREASIGSYNMVMGQYLPYFAIRSDNRVHFSMNIGGTQRNLFTDYNNLITDGVWYLLTFIHDYDGTNTTASIYMNGEFQSSASYIGAQATSSGRVFMLGGWRSDDPTNYPLYGEISQVKIYNKALTSSEVKQNFEATRSRYGI